MVASLDDVRKQGTVTELGFARKEACAEFARRRMVEHSSSELGQGSVGTSREVQKRVLGLESVRQINLAPSCEELMAPI